MKRVIVAFLLVIILFQSGGYSCVLFVQQYAIKYKMHFLKEFEKEKLQTIYFTSALYKTCKVDGHELKFNGKLYDIVFSEFKNGIFILKVIHDEEEESVLNEIAIFFKYKCKQNSKLPLKANQLSMAKYIDNHVDCLNINFNPSYLTILNNLLNSNLLNPFSSIFSPPPRFI